jgi:hypothetical protein
MQTTDMGHSWQKIYESNFPLQDIDFPTPKQGWAVGEKGNILRYHDTTGIADESEQIFIFPNPGDGLFHIAKAENIDLYAIQLYDALGRVIVDYDSDQNTLDLTDLPHRTYVLKCETGNGIIVNRLLKH